MTIAVPYISEYHTNGFIIGYTVDDGSSRLWSSLMTLPYKAHKFMMKTHSEMGLPPVSS